MGYDRRKTKAHRIIGGLAASVVAGCAVPMDTAQSGYFEPDELAPPTSSRAWEGPASAFDRADADTLHLDRTSQELTDGEIYDLATLLDLALQKNPTTREAWELARVRAAELGGELGAYLPDLEVEAQAGFAKYLFEAPDSPRVIKQFSVTPLIGLEWVLFDFGRRSAAVESARRQLLAANLEFNRALQDVIFSVQSAYFSLDAARGMLRAAERNLSSAKSVSEAADERLVRGLATKPDLLLAKQAEAKAAYDLEAARVLVSDGEASLALAVGVPANQPILIRPIEEISPRLSESVDAVIDAALADRPDLAARVQTLRAQEAVARKARADLYPQIFAQGTYGLDAWWYRFSGPPTIRSDTPVWNAGVGLRWSIFEGFERLNTIRAAEAEASRVRAALEQAELETVAAVWRAYHDQRAAATKYEYAQTLLTSSREAYESNLESYQRGLATVVDLLTAEGDLAEARYIVVQSRADLLTQAARVAYVAGEMPTGETP